MFRSEKQNVLSGKTKKILVNKKAVRHRKNCAARQKIDLLKTGLLELRELFHVLFAKVKISSAFFCFRAELSVIFD